MKKISLMMLLLTFSLVNAQAYKGKGDVKGQVGLNIQDGGTGITISSDFGIGENMSYGFTGTYLLNVKSIKIDPTQFYNENPGYDPFISGSVPSSVTPKFKDRFDLKARFNANLGNVIKLDPKMDVYPGLNLGLRNFGAHLGFRYFFTDGFGLYGEGGVPLARFDSSVSGVEYYNNQFVFNIGASFNL